MALQITVDQDAVTAPFEQIRAQIADLARSGALPWGYKLPTVRGFAEELGLAANTVAKAYRALEADGVIYTRWPPRHLHRGGGRRGPAPGRRGRPDLCPAGTPPRSGPCDRPRRRRGRAAGRLRRLRLNLHRSQRR
ncbi:hypothetical protein SANTM175S_08548 [Streptomyces antimycoticus]